MKWTVRRALFAAPLLVITLGQITHLEAQPATPIDIRLTPAEITAPLASGIGGTEAVLIEITNRTGEPLELHPESWLTIERDDAPGTPIFHPPPPYVPLVVKGGDGLKLTWRLRDAYEFHLDARQAHAAAGAHRIIITYRHPGGDVWDRQITKIELAGVSWLWVAGAVVAALVLFALWMMA